MPCLFVVMWTSHVTCLEVFAYISFCAYAWPYYAVSLDCAIIELSTVKVVCLTSNPRVN